MSLIERVKQHEGFMPKPYKDDKGVLTIGYGTNIDMGIDRNEAEMLLKYRLNRAISEVDALLGIETVMKLSQDQRDALYELNYWIGISKFRGFKRMITALKYEQYNKASIELMDSKLGREYTTRASKLAQRLKSDN